MSDPASVATAPDRMRPPFELEQEVRFAVVLYGGVSLAIYINGVAQELFRLVRATAPERPLAQDGRSEGEAERVYVPNERDATGREPVAGSERVYRTLGQLLGAAGAPRPAASPSDPVR